MFRRNRRFGRRSGARKTRVFWIRNTGVTTMTNRANTSSTLFDPLQFIPDPVQQRSDINADMTVMAVRFNYTATFFPTTLGTMGFLDLYMGIRHGDRNASPRSPAFSAASDARADYMDCWMDCAGPLTAGTTIFTQKTLGIANAPGMERFVKSKRKLESEENIFFDVVGFPHAGAGGNDSTVIQWQVSLLLRVG